MPMTPASSVPKVRRHWPVSVAMSTMASTGSSVGEDQGVGHDQPTLGVGVQHLDGAPAAHCDHVTELQREPDGMLSVHIR